MNSHENIKRALSLYTNEKTRSAITNHILTLMQEMEMGAKEDGLDYCEAMELSVQGVVQAVADSLYEADEIKMADKILSTVE